MRVANLAMVPGSFDHAGEAGSRERVPSEVTTKKRLGLLLALEPRYPAGRRLPAALFRWCVALDSGEKGKGRMTSSRRLQLNQASLWSSTVRGGAAYNAWEEEVPLAEEDDELGYQLARGYAEACRQIDRKADGYIDWAKSQYAKNDVVVYTVWPDHTKSHYINYELLQDKRRPGHPYGIVVILASFGRRQTGSERCFALLIPVMSDGLQLRQPRPPAFSSAGVRAPASPGPKGAPACAPARPCPLDGP